MREKDIKELRAISSLLMFEREVLINPTKRFINILTSALDEVESNAKSENESEGKSMLNNVTVKHEENKVLEEFWIMQAIKKDFQCDCMITCAGIFMGKGDKLLEEKELNHEPTPDEIAQFLFDAKADFVSVAQNYRFENGLPF